MGGVWAGLDSNQGPTDYESAARFRALRRPVKPDRDLWGDYWRFTTLSFRRLLEERFDAAAVRVEAYGNVIASIAFLHGLAAEELTSRDLALRDPDYELVIVAHARKGAAPRSGV